MGAVTTSTKLACLVRQQERDDQRRRVEVRECECLECDLVDEGEQFFDHVVDRRAIDPAARAEALDLPPGRSRVMAAPPILVMGTCHPWGPEQFDYQASQDCPVCFGRVPRHAYCLCCSATFDAPRKWSMRETVKRKARGKLKGGVRGKK